MSAPRSRPVRRAGHACGNTNPDRLAGARRRSRPRGHRGRRLASRRRRRDPPRAEVATPRSTVPGARGRSTTSGSDEAVASGRRTRKRASARGLRSETQPAANSTVAFQAEPGDGELDEALRVRVLAGRTNALRRPLGELRGRRLVPAREPRDDGRHGARVDPRRDGSSISWEARGEQVRIDFVDHTNPMRISIEIIHTTGDGHRPAAAPRAATAARKLAHDRCS